MRALILVVQAKANNVSSHAVEQPLERGIEPKRIA